MQFINQIDSDSKVNTCNSPLLSSHLISLSGVKSPTLAPFYTSLISHLHWIGMEEMVEMQKQKKVAREERQIQHHLSPLSLVSCTNQTQRLSSHTNVKERSKDDNNKANYEDVVIGFLFVRWISLKAGRDKRLEWKQFRFGFKSPFFLQLLRIFVLRRGPSQIKLFRSHIFLIFLPNSC